MWHGFQNTWYLFVSNHKKFCLILTVAKHFLLKKSCKLIIFMKIWTGILKLYFYYVYTWNSFALFLVIFIVLSSSIFFHSVEIKALFLNLCDLYLQFVDISQKKIIFFSWVSHKIERLKSEDGQFTSLKILCNGKEKRGCWKCLKSCY